MNATAVEKEKKAGPAKAAAADRTPKASKTAGAKPASAEATKLATDRLYHVLLAPIVSEKATMLADKREQVLFKVAPTATKPEVKAAVEMLFKVNVESVQMLVQKGKVKRSGRTRTVGRRSDVKKAFVSLAAGQEINFAAEAK